MKKRKGGGGEGGRKEEGRRREGESGLLGPGNDARRVRFGGLGHTFVREGAEQWSGRADVAAKTKTKRLKRALPRPPPQWRP
jgi:hypothetical protein